MNSTCIAKHLSRSSRGLESFTNVRGEDVISAELTCIIIIKPWFNSQGSVFYWSIVRYDGRGEEYTMITGLPPLRVSNLRHVFLLHRRPLQHNLI